MNKYDLVELIDDDEILRGQNILRGCNGTIVAKLAGNIFRVVFFNKKNEGEYAIAEVSGAKLKKVGNFPKSMIGELNSFLNNESIYKHTAFTDIALHEYDKVELVVEKEKYANCGVHKGDTGCVVSSYAIDNEVEVDFTRVDDSGNVYGDVLPVKIVDLQKC